VETSTGRRYHWPTVTVKNLQTGALTVSALFVPIAFAGESWLSQSNFFGIAFFVVLYACVLIAVSSTLVRYRSEQRISLASWRRIPYSFGLILLLLLCLCSLAIWFFALDGVALTGTSHRPDYLFLCLLGANVIAAIFIWFCSGWSRVGLTVVAFWICFLWAFPLGVGV
jgi:hypothetical protein